MTTVKKLSVRLLREGRSVEDALTPRFSHGTERALVRESWNQVSGADMLYGQIYKNTPGWTRFAMEGLYGVNRTRATVDEELLALESSGAGCAIFLPVGGRLMAACFGRIHLALNDDAFERQFGLKVALNAVPRSGLRTLDLSTPDAVTFQRRIQASRDSDVGDFGVDAAQDLAKVAGGTPRDDGFARFVAGRDSLSLACEVSPESLQDKCQEVLEMYERTTYTAVYPWVDQVVTVKEKDVIEKLDAALFRAIRNLQTGGHEDLHLAPPEIVDYMAGSELRFAGFGGEKTSFNHLSIDAYVRELNSRRFRGGIDAIKNRHVAEAMVDESGIFAKKWRVYHCFVYETTLGGDGNDGQYVLSGGTWHRVADAFRQRVEGFFNGIERRAIIGGTRCKNESALIADLDDKRNDLLKLDGAKINPGGVARAQIEPCDFLSRDGEFIHIKDGESSGRISHLWSQGAVSIDALVSDEVFIRALRNEVAKRNHNFLDVLPGGVGNVVREKLSVIYAIMRRPYRDGSIGIPFFSKVSAQASIQNIRKLAPRHSEWVGVDERLRMLDVPPMLSGDPQHTRRTTP